MKLIERIKPEVMEVIKYKLPLFLEEWLEKEITPIELPIGLANVLYRDAYDGPFDYGKYLRMFEEPIIDMTLEEAVNKGFDKRMKLNLNEDDELFIYEGNGPGILGRDLNFRDKYEAIIAWGQFVGSSKYYVDMELLKAINDDDVPELAIYKIGDLWETLGDVKNKATKQWFIDNHYDLAVSAGFIDKK